MAGHSGAIQGVLQGITDRNKAEKQEKIDTAISLASDDLAAYILDGIAAPDSGFKKYENEDDKQKQLPHVKQVIGEPTIDKSLAIIYKSLEQANIQPMDLKIYLQKQTMQKIARIMIKDYKDYSPSPTHAEVVGCMNIVERELGMTFLQAMGVKNIIKYLEEELAKDREKTSCNSLIK